MITALKRRGITATVAPCGPTSLEVETAVGTILVACDFNWDGWEAVLERDAEQLPLLDGPQNTASIEEVAAWIERLAKDPLGSAA